MFWVIYSQYYSDPTELPELGILKNNDAESSAAEKILEELNRDADNLTHYAKYEYDYYDTCPGTGGGPHLYDVNAPSPQMCAAPGCSMMLVY